VCDSCARCAGRHVSRGPLRRRAAGISAGAPGIQRSHADPTATSRGKFCLRAPSAGRAGDRSPTRSSEMNESSTDEKEGFEEAPEQPEPPRVRSAAPARKINLPPDADLERLVHDSSPETLT